MKIIRQIGSLAFVLGFFVAVFAGIPWYTIVSDDPVVPWWLRIAIFSILGGILIVLITVALEQGTKGAKREELLLGEPDPSVLLSNSTRLPGREVTGMLGLVQGHTVYAIWLGKDLSALVRLIIGGELIEYTEIMGNARAVATARMVEQAKKLDADAVINVRYMTTSVIGTAAELLAYGTAVKLSD